MIRPKDSTSLSKHEIEGMIKSSILSITERLKSLEDEVFGKRPPGPPRLGAQLEDLGDRLELLDKKMTTGLAILDEKYAKRTKEIIRTVAELRSLVEELRKAQERFYLRKWEREA